MGLHEQSNTLFSLGTAIFLEVPFILVETLMDEDSNLISSKTFAIGPARRN